MRSAPWPLDRRDRFHKQCSQHLGPGLSTFNMDKQVCLCLGTLQKLSGKNDFQWEPVAKMPRLWGSNTCPPGGLRMWADIPGNQQNRPRPSSSPSCHQSSGISVARTLGLSVLSLFLHVAKGCDRRTDVLLEELERFFLKQWFQLQHSNQSSPCHMSLL